MNSLYVGKIQFFVTDHLCNSESSINTLQFRCSSTKSFIEVELIRIENYKNRSRTSGNTVPC